MTRLFEGDGFGGGLQKILDIGVAVAKTIEKLGGGFITKLLQYECDENNGVVVVAPILR